MYQVGRSYGRQGDASQKVICDLVISPGLPVEGPRDEDRDDRTEPATDSTGSIQG